MILNNVWSSLFNYGMKHFDDIDIRFRMNHSPINHW